MKYLSTLLKQKKIVVNLQYNKEGLVSAVKSTNSMLPWVYSGLVHRKRQSVVETSVTLSPVARVPLLCFYHFLTSSVIYILS